jgi:hypothetical protein
MEPLIWGKMRGRDGIIEKGEDRRDTIRGE